MTNVDFGRQYIRRELGCTKLEHWDMRENFGSQRFRARVQVFLPLMTLPCANVSFPKTQYGVEQRGAHITQAPRTSVHFVVLFFQVRRHMMSGLKRIKLRRIRMSQSTTMMTNGTSFGPRRAHFAEREGSTSRRMLPARRCRTAQWIEVEIPSDVREEVFSRYSLEVTRSFWTAHLGF